MRPQQVLGGTFKLLDGHEIPLVGFGTSPKTWLTGWKWSQLEMDTAIEAALGSGYRLFDTANFYSNDDVLSNAFNKLLPKFNLTREDIFVTSKVEIIIPNIQENTRRILDKSIKAFEYLDLILIHYPKYEALAAPGIGPRRENDSKDNQNDRYEIYDVLEEYKDKGKIFSIGVSNFEPRHIEELLPKVKYPPTVNQCEFHPHLCRPELKKYCQENGIFLQAHTSLARNNEELYNEHVLKELAAKYSTSLQHLLLAFAYKQNVGVIPKSVNPERIRGNLKFLDIDLSDEDIKKLLTLDKGHKGHYTPCNQWNIL
uniref:NADP-dependent oxidoreductase domain-containing protein n=1 Tax=Acrobeloides nanus TaxID=290746 RepID=A0A914C1W7_9BILA